MEKEQLTISADLESSEKVKELLDDLEVLKDKYDMSVLLTISPKIEWINKRDMKF
ncbi:hypothetical protein ACI1T5_00730 [Lactococcus petauri]|uniref:hypothetical protein n=1 Tax=Lactococcus TaxID=1357 RepID=UPI0013FD5440|nr:MULTISPECIES: hypothetical protein [Lactococcus]MDT2620413.1 hypothetical protein [Lactococcus petauri]